MRLTVQIPSEYKAGYFHEVGEIGYIVERLGSKAALVEIRVDDPTLVGDAWYDVLELRVSEFEVIRSAGEVT